MKKNMDSNFSLKKTAFIFSGLGAQWKTMGSGLLDKEVFHRKLVECDQLFSKYTNRSLLREIEKNMNDSRMEESEIAHRCTFAIQVALSDLLSHWGVRPDAVVGHSAGEVAAAYAAGILSLEDAVTVVWQSCLLIRRLKGEGRLLFAALSAREAENLLRNGSDLSIAAHNGPQSVVISGTEGISDLKGELDAQGTFSRILNLDLAFHSSQLDPHLPEFRKALGDIRTLPPKIPIYSTLHGGLSVDGSDYEGDYWARHIREPVRFESVMHGMFQDGCNLFIEVSPHPVLSASVHECLQKHGKEEYRVVGTLTRDCDEWKELMKTFSSLSSLGVEMKWDSLRPSDREQIHFLIDSAEGGGHEDERNEEGFSDAGDSELIPKIKDYLTHQISAISGTDVSRADSSTNLMEMGLDSVSFIRLSETLESAFDIRFPPTLFFAHQNTDDLTDYLEKTYAKEMSAYFGTSDGKIEPAYPRHDEKPMTAADVQLSVPSDRRDVAIVGMSGIFPGASDPETFWRNLTEGKDSVTEIPEDREELTGHLTENKVMEIKWGGFVRDMDKFDPQFFRMSPREAALTDPQQRLLLEVVWQTIEDAGYSASTLAGSRTGVFAGIGTADYAELIAATASPVEAHTSVGTAASVLSNRISHLFDFHGPSVTLDTACSSSLIAVHQAVSAIRYAECDLAVAGGVNALLSPRLFLSFAKAGMLSPDGRCRTFDKRANGYVRGEGVAAILLKPLDRARVDRDNIYAVIRSTSVNHDGRTGSLTAPNPQAQAELITDAYRKAGIDPATVGYIEAHGTGTELGDPLEIQGLTTAFTELYAEWGKETPGQPHCGIGSLKTHIGHLEAAAGIVGLIKILLSLKHKKIPGNLHFEEMNPYIDLRDTPFYILDRTQTWESLRDEAGRIAPRRAGISAFGFGGANAHVVLEEHGNAFGTDRHSATDPNEPQIILLSARNEERLRAYAGNLASFLRRTIHTFEGDSGLSDIFQADLIGIASDILDVAKEEIDLDGDLGEQGLDPVRMATFSERISERYDLAADLRLLGKHPSIRILATHLIGAHCENIRRHCPERSEEKLASDVSENGIRLADVAWTLQVGREPMQERLAFVVTNISEMIEKLARYAESGKGGNLLHAGNVKEGGGKSEPVVPGESGEQFVKTLIDQRNFDKLARVWVSGTEVNWKLPYPQDTPHRISLPTYPFARERHWIPEVGRTAEGQRVADVRETSSGSVPKNNALENIKEELMKERITEIREMIHAVSGIESSEITDDTHLFSLGIDSLMLMQLRRKIAAQYDIDISSRAFAEELTTIREIAGHVHDHLPATAEPISAVKQTSDMKQHFAITNEEIAVPNLTPDDDEVISSVTETGLIERVMALQLETFSNMVSQQLEVMGKSGDSANPPKSDVQKPVVTEQKRTKTSVRPTMGSETSAKALTAKTSVLPFPKLRAEDMRSEKLSPHQQNHLDALIGRINSKTHESKRRSQKYRQVLADNRASTGFRISTKEMLYPIIGESAEGSRLRDVDGNEYIDLAMGFGVNLFGHYPPFVIESLERQLRLGIQLGDQTGLAGEVAQLVSELTGMERVAFCNSGTEAVMTAIRLACTAATGRTKIATFGGSYHGHFDGTLGIPRDGNRVPYAIPMVTGVRPNMVADLMLTEYGNFESLDILRGHAHELAAVLVEPVQSRRPDLQPREFLHQLRIFTEDNGIALIFDEMITGFRIHPGGAQAWFDVRADMATYGKIAGGGMPIGIVAGKAAYMDCIDGGMWRYGDTSYPQGDMTFFAGTFCKHPLTMAASQAVLSEIRIQGPSLQDALNERTAYLTSTLNSWFTETDTPIRTTHFGSLFRFVFRDRNTDLLFYHLLDKGVYTWEGPTCFLSAAHTDEDIAHVIQAVKESVAELREAGFLPSPKKKARRNGQALTDNNPLTVPLSEVQKLYWVLSRISGEADVSYNISVCLRLKGALRIPALRGAIQQTVDRHESMRTTLDGEREVQCISPYLKMELPLTDLSDRTSSEQDAALDEWFSEENRRPFDLAQGPLFRAYLIRLAERHHILVLTAHHSIWDGWSMGIVTEEVVALYSALVQGKPSDLPKPMQFREYTQWYAEYAESEAMKAHESFWLRQFADPFPITELFPDRPRPPLKTYRGNTRSVEMEKALYSRLRAFARRHACTLFTTLFSGYLLMIHRLTREDDIVIGIPVGVRPIEASETFVGDSSNPLAIRSHLSGDPSFPEFLKTTEKRLHRAFEHQAYQLEKLAEKLAVPRDESRSPLVETFFNLDPPIRVPEMFGLETAFFVSSARDFAPFDLFLNAIETGDDLLLDWIYNTDLFDDETVERLSGCFLTLLKQMVTDGEKPISEFSLLTETEQRQNLAKWDGIEAAPPADRCLHHLFENLAEQTPEAVAVIGQREMTYGELNARANQLAHHLQSLGVGPEVPVGIRMEGFEGMIVGLLGILKAGGVCVALDSAVPKDRIAFILKDSAARLLLTEERLLPGLPAHEAILCIDRESGTFEERCDNPPTTVRPENLATIIYPSDAPAGVMLSHAGLVSLAFRSRRSFGIIPSDRAAVPAGPMCHVHMWPYLAAGACVFPIRPEIAGTAVELRDQLISEGMTVGFVPAHATKPFFALEWPVESGVRMMLTGGDRLCARPSEALPFRVVNTYGPAEAAFVTTAGPVSAEPPGRPAHIGQPADNLNVRLLDRHLTPVPVGVPGEMAIGGIGLARGYLNGPMITAERFIPDPFGEPGSRIFKTGDLIRQFSDGTMECLGPMNQQIRIKSFRIELGAIETALAQHPSVRESVVVPWTDGYGEECLVAHIVQNPEDEQDASNVDLRAYLKEKLPVYMIPATFLLTESLPLTPEGRVDRKSSPAPAPDTLQKRAFTPPRTPTEELIVGVWTEWLKRERISVYDNFFDLGGDSFQAVRSISVISEKLDIDVPAKLIFIHPTVEELARAIPKECKR